MSQPPRTPRRTTSIDVLRGVFILLMTVGFAIPAGLFPDWMYHRQFPTEIYVAITGLTWRDVTFGGFLFTLSVAIPLTMTARLDRGSTWRGIVWVALRRAFLLFAFALIIGHASRAFTDDYTLRGRLVSIAGYLLCLVIFTRRPPSWNPRIVGVVQALGWIGVVALFAMWPRLYGSGFSPGRRDDIIALLAFAALVGIVIWLATRGQVLARLGILAVLMALRLSALDSGWVQDLWAYSPAPWLFHWSFLDLLLVVIPGTIAGDAIVEWSREEHPPGRWSRRRLWVLALIAVVVEPVVVYGLYRRWTLGTLVTILAVAVLVLLMVRSPHSPSEILVGRLMRFGLFWTVLALALEPFEGGVAKVPGTMSYYLIVLGISICLLTAVVIVLDLLATGEDLLQPVADVGQNPMAAYMLMPMLVLPALELVPNFVPVASSPFAAIVRIVLWLFITAGLIGFLSRKKLFWRT